MSIILHVGRWQLWLGWHEGWHAGRTSDVDWTIGLTVEVY